MKNAAFAAMVERGMRARGLGLRALCRELKLDPSFFSKVLAGKRSPPAEEAVLRRLAGLLGLDPVELVVSTGRIPSEWEGLFRDPATLQTLRRLAQGGRAPRPTAAAAPAPRAPAQRAALSEELL